MDDERLFIDLSSDDDKLIEKALLSLSEKLVKSSGVLVMRDLSKLRASFLKIFESRDKFKESKVFTKTFEFLTSFFTNNYGSDYEIQFTSHVLQEIIKYCVEVDDNTIELAEETLETYIRSYKQLENVLDFLILKVFTSDDFNSIVKGIKLAVKNIEYHPKIISATSRTFINFIETLWNHIKGSNSLVAEESKAVILSFMKRFPATMKEISNEMDSRNIDDLSKLIKERNDTIQYK